MNIRDVGNIIGAFIGLAIVATIAANPEFLRTTFSGIAGVISAAEAPVTKKK